VGPRAGLDRCVKSRPPPGFDPRTVQTVAIQLSRIVGSAHTVFMCFVFISEKTATCATYSINWLVFITEMKSVYSAVRTGSLYIAVFGFKGLQYLRHWIYPRPSIGYVAVISSFIEAGKIGTGSINVKQTHKQTDNAWCGTWSLIVVHEYTTWF